MTSTSRYSSDAEALADSVLRAAGSGLRHYSMYSTRQAILKAAQDGIDKAGKQLAAENAAELLKALVKMERVFGPGVDSFGDGAGCGEIDALRATRIAIAKASGGQI